MQSTPKNAPKKARLPKGQACSKNVAKTASELKEQTSSQLHLENLASRVEARDVEFVEVGRSRILLDQIQEVRVRNTIEAANVV